MTEDDFLAIQWPDTFVVHRIDGNSETLLKGQGVSYEGPEDDPEGRGGISATMLPAKSGQGHRYLRHYYFNEFARITDTKGGVLWEAQPDTPMQPDGTSGRR